MSRCHKVLGPARLPDKIVLSSKVMVTVCAVNTAVQPASQRVPIDRSMPSFKSGTMWTKRALAGSAGMSSSASWVECMILPLGLLILMGCRVGRTLVTAAVIVAKLPVLPVSAMVVGIVDGEGGTVGGPSGATLIVQDGSVVTMVFNLVVLLLGSPRPHVLGVVVG